MAAASAAAGSATPALNTGDTAWMLTSTALVSLILLKIVDLTIGLRVDADVEREGLDLAPHGEAVQ
jgi:ammonia channel protein AmtB